MPKMKDDSIRYEQEVFRKLIHLSSLWMVAAMLYFPKWPLVVFFAILLGLNLLVEFAYSQNWPVIAPLYGRLFRRMLRREPQPGQLVVSGSPPVLASAALTTILFPSWIAASAFAVMLLGDTAAALVGRRVRIWPRLYNGKSYEGCIAFVLAALIVVATGCFGGGWTPGLVCVGCVAAVLAAFVELFGDKVKFDDNFSIPLITGAVLYAGEVWLCA